MNNCSEGRNKGRFLVRSHASHQMKEKYVVPSMNSRKHYILMDKYVGYQEWHIWLIPNGTNRPYRLRLRGVPNFNYPTNTHTHHSPATATHANTQIKRILQSLKYYPAFKTTFMKGMLNGLYFGIKVLSSS